MSEAKELLVISGKGGTGKTSLSASFAILAEDVIVADCDVDAADLHLLLAPEVKQSEIFKAGHEAVIRDDDCVGCGGCYARCRFSAIKKTRTDTGEFAFSVNPLSCEGCGVCVEACPVKAIDFPEAECGKWFVSGTRAGTMVHAKLNPGGENSGKLVALVRKEAKEFARTEGKELIVIDGPPGVGCPVIASLGGVNLALVVTEPTISGEHDLERVLRLCKHFDVSAAVCVNKWDINPEQAEKIEALATEKGAAVAGRVSYAKDFTSAQREMKTIVEFDASGLAEEVRTVWNNVKGMLS